MRDITSPSQSNGKICLHLLDSVSDSTSYQSFLNSTQSSVQLLRENTNSVRSNQRISPTAPSEPLKIERYCQHFSMLQLVLPKLRLHRQQLVPDAAYVKARGFRFESFWEGNPEKAEKLGMLLELNQMRQFEELEKYFLSEALGNSSGEAGI
ncbi:hypothetical protein Tco_0446639 [Tanacetum coccineum]